MSGQRHKAGDTYIGVDGCNSCKCLVSHGVAASACTMKSCPNNDAEMPIGICVDYQGNPHVKYCGEVEDLGNGASINILSIGSILAINLMKINV